MLLPHHRNPLSLEKDIPLYLGYRLPLAITKHPLFWVFSGNLPETILPKNTPPLSRYNGNTHGAPSCIRVRGGGAGYAVPLINQDRLTQDRSHSCCLRCTSHGPLSRLGTRTTWVCWCSSWAAAISANPASGPRSNHRSHWGSPPRSGWNSRWGRYAAFGSN